MSRVLVLVVVAVAAMGFLATKGPLAGAERGDESPQRRGEAPRHTDRQPDGREVVVVTKAAQRGKRMCVCGGVWPYGAGRIGTHAGNPMHLTNYTYCCMLPGPSYE